MLTTQELVIEANKCLINNNPPEGPDLDIAQLRLNIGPENMQSFLNCLEGTETELATITLYRDKFYYYEHDMKKMKDGTYRTTSVLKDESGNVHTIIKDGVETLFTKEL